MANRRISVEFLEKITGKYGEWFTGKGGGLAFAREFPNRFPNIYKFNKYKFIDLLNESLESYGIVTPYQQAHFISQCFHESAHFETTVEFASGEGYDPGRHDDAIANGNTEVGDGAKFKGRGLIQLTWKKNYRAYSDYKGFDFISKPDIVAESMQSAIDASCWYWRFKGAVYNKYNAKGNINILIDNDPYNVNLVTMAVNGGTNGLAERLKIFNAVKEAWSL
jgi:predicted chitinase